MVSPLRSPRLLVLPILIAAGLTAASAGSRPASGQEPVAASFELVDRAPWVGAEDQVPFAIRLEPGTEPAELEVRLRIRRPLRSVTELLESATDDVGAQVFTSPTIPVSELGTRPDGTVVVAVKTSPEPGDPTVADLSDAGVHSLIIELLTDGVVVDEIRTPLVRLPDEGETITAPALALVVDVATDPTLRADGTQTVPAGEIERIREVLDVVAAHPSFSPTLAARPDTVDALAATTDGEAELNRMRGADLLALPYLPLPVDRLADTDLAGQVDALTALGVGTLEQRLGTSPRPGIWDPGTTIDASGAALLAASGHRTVLVDSDQLDHDGDGQADEDRGDDRIKAGPIVLDGLEPLTGIVVDAGLSRRLGALAPSEGDAAHWLLAELLVTGLAEDDVLVARPTRVTARSELAGLLDLVDDPASPLRVGGLDLLAGREAGDDHAAWIAPAGPDLGAHLGRIRNVVDRVGAFTALTGGNPAQARLLGARIATALSTATAPSARPDAVAALETSVSAAFDAIRLVGQIDLNLTSRRGTLPITVQNDNPFPVSVVVRVRSDRLAFPEGTRFALEVGDEPVRIDVPVEALASGSVPVFVQLWTADDTIQLAGRQLNVRSTAISGVGLVLSVGALGFLVVWWVRNWRKTKRRPVVPGSPVAEGAME